MLGGIVVCLLLGCLFGYLAAWQYRRSARWHGAVRLLAVVSAVRYREAWQRKTEINDHKSSTEAILRFTDQDRTYEKRRQFSGIIHAPVPGQKLPILFDRNSGEWIFRREAHTHWRLLLAFSVVFTAAGLLLLLDGHRILAELANYHVETPNLAGSVVCALIGLVCGACAYACIRGLMPDLFRTSAAPYAWMLGFYVLHRYEELDALCVGIIRRESGDDDVSYYPFFQYSADGRLLHWFPRRQMSPKRYRAGNRYTLYRDPGTGRCALKPTVWDLICAPLSLIPIAFFTVLILSLVVCAAGTVYIAGIGFLSLLGS